MCADGGGKFATSFPLLPIFIAIGPHRESRQYHIDKKKQAQDSRERLLGNYIKKGEGGGGEKKKLENIEGKKLSFSVSCYYKFLKCKFHLDFI